MSNIPALGARPLSSSLYTANPQNDGKTGNAGALKKAGIADTPISLSNDAIDLQKRVASVGNATVDFAQDFVGSFTQALFGDAAKGATIDFDSASLDASSSYAVGLRHTEGPNGTSDAAAFKLSDSSHFIGKGTITTADGRKFDFEVEVQYNYDLSAAASQSQTKTQNQTDADTGSDKPVASNAKDLPSVQVPNIDFPGTLADLFKLIGRDLQTALSTGDKSDNQTGNGIDRNTLRSLSLRLLNLVDSKDSSTYAPPVSADKAKSATNAYDAQAASADAPPAAAPAVPAPAVDPIPAAAAGDDGKSATAASS